MDVIIQFLIDWGYWGLFIGSFVAGSVIPFSSEATNTASELKGMTLPATNEPIKSPQYPQSIKN